MPIPSTTARPASRSRTARPRPRRTGPTGPPTPLAAAIPAAAPPGGDGVPAVSGPSGGSSRAIFLSRVAWNFLSLGAAEVACRATSVLVTLSLARELGKAGFGRVEFAFNVVFWLVLLVRNGSEVIAARELARHPRLIRPLVDQILGIKVLLAAALFVGLAAAAWLGMVDPIGRALLLVYGLLLGTTALGIDFVYRGVERMGLLAVSLYFRTAVYAVGVCCWVNDLGGIVAIPAWLAAGEALGIALIWARYVREYGWPRPALSGRFLAVFARRCRPVLIIQLAQTVLGSVDLMVVGLLCPWDEVGLYGAPHRMIAAALTFGMIFQQVVFPTLARSWRETPAAGRRALDALVRALMIGFIPLAVGTTVLADPLIAAILPPTYHGGGWLLALGIWRAPLLTLVFLYHTALIATNRESAGVRLLAVGAIGSGPLVAALLLGLGLPGAAVGLVAVAALLVGAGYACLAREGRQPAWHHHAARPLLASLAMVPACLALTPVHLVAAVAGGALAYLVALAAIGGLRRDDLRAIFGPIA